MKEVWKDIKCYEGLYQVSNLGRVMRNKRVLKSYFGTDKYYYVSLSKNSKVNKFKTHRLVAQAFIPNPENKPTVDHINRDRLDNRVEAARFLKTDVRNVKSALHGYSKTTHGYEVQYGY